GDEDSGTGGRAARVGNRHLAARVIEGGEWHEAMTLIIRNLHERLLGTAAYLVVEQSGTRRAGAIDGRVLIGRRTSNQIVIPDRAVSRIHAWIGRGESGYYVADTGSRTGTGVNGQKLHGRQT